MNIVIVGAKDRNSADDVADVSRLLDLLEARYGVFTVITIMCHTGIGKIVKTVADVTKDGRQHRFPFCEADIHVYAKNLTRNAMTQLYISRNAMLFEIGDMFFSFPHPQRRAVVDELIDKRVVPSGRPYKVFQCGDPIEIEEM